MSYGRIGTHVRRTTRRGSLPGLPPPVNDAPPGTTGTISRRSSAAVTASTVIAGVSGYAIIWLASDVLGAEGFARFQVFWGLYFALLGILFGLQQESTRSVSAAVALRSADDAATRPARVRVVPACLGIGAVAGVVVAATAPAWTPSVFDDGVVLLTVVVALAATLYAGQTGLLGALAGTRQWGTVAGVITAEAALRLVAVAVAAGAGLGVLGMSVATGVAAIAWVGVLALPRGRAALQIRGDAPVRPFLRTSGHAMVAAASSALLVMGFPTVLEMTTPGRLGEAAAPLLLAVTLTRAPLLVPMNAFQGVAINHFVSRRGALLRALRVPGAALAGVGLLGALAAWAVGEPLITAVFSDAYSISPVVLAALMGSATLVAGLTLTGAATLAANRHRVYVAGWITASVVFVLLLLLPGAVTSRALVSLTVGPLAGILVHLVALRRPPGTTEPPDGPSPVPPLTAV